MRIRQVNPKNKAIKSLLLYLQKKTLPYDKPYDTSNGTWWIAYDEENKPIGFAGLVQSSQWLDTGYLCRAGVLLEHHGKGIQKRLIGVRLRHAKKLGYNWCISDTRENPPSSNSLINQGFKLYEPSNPYGDTKTLYWRKDLNAVQRPKRPTNKRSTTTTLRKKQGSNRKEGRSKKKD